MAAIDNELKACADVALRNAYFTELRALVAKYREAATGLGTDMETGQAQVEIHTWGDNADGTLVEHDQPGIWTDWLLPKGNIFGPGARASCGHRTILEALQDERAERVGLEGKVVFVKKDGEWLVAEDKDS